MVTLNVSGHLFTLPEADILKYPYSKLADVASCSLADDVASLNVPADVCLSIVFISYYSFFQLTLLLHFRSCFMAGYYMFIARS